MKFNFSPEIIHLYGPFGVHSYGFFIALGIITVVTAIRYNKRFTQLGLEPVFMNIVAVGIIAGCIGGRFLEVISEPFLYPHWYDWFTLWQGGFSILGSILGVIIIMPFYLRSINVPILPLFDLVSIYIPLLQSIGRLGCFTAGCCYGSITNNIFAVIYTNPHTLAPYGIPLHPTQLYSSTLLFGIFLLMYFVVQPLCKKNGQIFGIYLIFASLERFWVDFWRSDRILIGNFFLSLHQIIACIIIIVSLLVLTIPCIKNKCVRLYRYIQKLNFDK
ncbi:MAG TPA: prolipoprotein diacylglyceryl transferase [Candidatus Babeliales bacterium]|nr:prolipoprotein diacylglyceryl transferase [Candidatus Babeliales bacterium]